MLALALDGIDGTTIMATIGGTGGITSDMPIHGTEVSTEVAGTAITLGTDGTILIALLVSEEVDMRTTTATVAGVDTTLPTMRPTTLALIQKEDTTDLERMDQVLLQRMEGKHHQGSKVPKQVQLIRHREAILRDLESEIEKETVLLLGQGRREE